MPEPADAPGNDYPGIVLGDKIVREIRKPNGDRITLFESGSVVVQKAGGSPRTRTPDGHLWTIIDGQPIETILRRKIAAQERPLNVASMTSEPIGRELSNFTERRFVLDGLSYHSIEGWYQGLKWPDKKKRAAIARLSGAAAKKAAKGAPSMDHFIYQGREIALGSEEHHQLIKTAIRASLEPYPEIVDAFCQTYPRPIVHDTGRPEKPGSALPGAKFSQILEEIRAEFVRAKAGRPPRTEPR